MSKATFSRFQKSAKPAAPAKKPAAKKADTHVEVTEFKGSAIFGIVDTDRFNENPEDPRASLIRFGVRKAKAILAHLDDLKAFVAENE